MLLKIIHIFACLYVLAAFAAPAVGKKPKRLGQSRYYRGGKTIYYGIGSSKKPLENADAASFVELIPCPHPYRYGVALAADKNAFYLYDARIPFTGANKTRLVGCFNYGDCMHLIVQNNTLFRINQNEKKVQRIATVAAKFAAFPPSDDYTSPGYFKDKTHIYYFDITRDTLTPLKNATVEKFQPSASQYSFTPHWGQDTKRVYVGAQQIHGAHAKTFQYVGWVYAKDRSRVYCLRPNAKKAWFAIAGADPDSFEPVKGRGVDACDNKHCYSGGRSVRDR